MNPAPARPQMVIVERDVPFGRSCIWDLQTRFFVERGPRAWKTDGVPSYLTSNPAMAFTYAGILRAWVDRLGGEPPVIVELGAGSGALAFRLLTALSRGGSPGIRYVMTDIASQNLAAWEAHPRLAPFAAAGVLDFALFDARDPGPLRLRGSGEVLEIGSDLSGVAVLGNYVLDSIPQDLFFVKDGNLFEGLCTVLAPMDPDRVPLAGRLNRLDLTFSTRPIPPGPYANEELNQLVEWYRTNLQEAYVLVPSVALGALDFLRSMAAGGRLLGLFADKGRWLAGDLDGSGPPVPAHHGSFSIEVNFHAHAEHCSAAGGSPLLPNGGLPGITVACFDYGATGLEPAYRSLVDGGGPEAVFRAINEAVPSLGAKPLEELLDLSALGRHDPLTFQLMLPRLRQLAPGFDAGQSGHLSAEMAAVWEQYFPAGVAGEADLGYELGVLSILIGDLEAATGYLSGSIELLGPSTGPQFTLAACYEGMGKPEQAVEVAQQIVDREPMNGPARNLLVRCREAMSNR